MPSIQECDNRVAETHSGASEVQGFAPRTSTSYAFPSADVLVPAPMAVSILGQLTIAATATDFKLVEPKAGFQHVQYPNSFRATIIQLVDSGALSLNKSFANFDEINKRCAAVRPGVNNVLELLVGHEDNSPEQNDKAIKRHLPNQIASLRKTIEACLAKAKETRQMFSDLLALVMEIHESCAATQGENENHVREASDLQKAYLENEEATKEMRRIGEAALAKAREEFTHAQEMFNNAANDMSGGSELTWLDFFDRRSNFANALTIVFKVIQHVFSRTVSSTPATPIVQPSPPVDLSDVNDPGYQRASALCAAAESLHVLLTAGTDGHLDWNSIKSHQSGGWLDIKVRCDKIRKSLPVNNRYAGRATNTAIGLARRGKDLAQKLGSVVPPGSQSTIEQLTRDVSAWREDVVSFACEADLKLSSSRLSSNTFLSDANFVSGGGRTDHLTAMQAQLNTSRESLKAAEEKLMEVDSQLANIARRRLALKIDSDAQTPNWKEITDTLLKATHFLRELKAYLNNLVHFFDALHNLVSVTLKDAADHFTSAMEDKSGRPGVKQAEDIKSARQAIYTHALSVAKIGITVENVSNMYVTLYNSNVHPGVNMLLGMEGLVSSNDHEAVAAAGKELQDWAEGASDRIVDLIAERTHANEQDIQKRMRELEKSFGEILLQSSSSIEEIVHDV